MIKIKHDKRTPGTSGTCEWTGCRFLAVGELRGHTMNRPNRLPWAMCALHLDPKMHPEDLRSELVTW